MNNLKNITRVVLLVLFAISLVVLGYFWLGGTEDVALASGSYPDVPTHTQMMLNWAYILMGLTIAVTLISALGSFVMQFVSAPKRGLISLAVLVVFALVFVISWHLGSQETVNIIGYEGTDNSGVMAQYSDMCLNSMYILIGGVILALFGSAIYAKLF